MPRTFFQEPIADKPAPRPAARGEPLLILGASTRAAAHSAIRAGFAPLCGDLFADLDLRACSAVLGAVDYPRGLVAAAAAVPPSPWIYTGGLENHPALVRRISRSRPLWGNGADVLAKVRDPWNVARVLSEAGLPALSVWPRDRSPPLADATWVRKPLRGAAGRGICLWKNGLARTGDLRERHYFQERRDGIPISGLYLAYHDRTVLLGITRQLVGVQAVHAPPFAWCGTIAPAAVSPEVHSQVARVGETLAAWAGLRGLFGCDFLAEAGVPWLTEVNPRYPASTELVEHLLCTPLLDWHRRACESFAESQLVVPPSGGRAFKPPEGGTPAKPPEGGTTNGTTNVLGKIILYANRSLKAPDLSRFIDRPRSWMTGEIPTTGRLPYLADIPVSGTNILAGQPICTLFARAPNETECLAKLVRRAARLEKLLS